MFLQLLTHSVSPPEAWKLPKTAEIWSQLLLAKMRCHGNWCCTVTDDCLPTSQFSGWNPWSRFLTLKVQDLQSERLQRSRAGSWELLSSLLNSHRLQNMCETDIFTLWLSPWWVNKWNVNSNILTDSLDISEHEPGHTLHTHRTHTAKGCMLTVALA